MRLSFLLLFVILKCYARWRRVLLFVFYTCCVLKNIKFPLHAGRIFSMLFRGFCNKTTGCNDQLISLLFGKIFQISINISTMFPVESEVHYAWSRHGCQQSRKRKCKTRVISLCNIVISRVLAQLFMTLTLTGNCAWFNTKRLYLFLSTTGWISFNHSFK